jgi:hypothetical protein
MWNEFYIAQFIKGYLPPGSEILMIKESYPKPAIVVADFDGDDVPEIAVVYKLSGQNHLLLLKNFCNSWHVLAKVQGRGYDINYMNSIHFTTNKANDLIVGWQVEKNLAELNIFKWSEDEFENVAPEELRYSKIKIEDMNDNKEDIGKCNIALWKHDKEEAYKVEIYKWSYGIFEPALDAYPYYFKKVASYYNRLIKREPDSSLYWYYLADAQLKAGMKDDALKTVEAALKFEEPYPSREFLVKLRVALLLDKVRREVSLYPAQVKGLEGRNWGYINSEGELVIRPQYDYAAGFQANGLAIVSSGNYSGVIDSTGKYVIEPKYDTIAGFSEGRAAVSDGEGFRVIDESGKILTAKAYDFVDQYQEGRAKYTDRPSENEYLYGYLDREGREIIPAKYMSAYDFKNGKAVVKLAEGQFALIDTNGNMLQRYNFNFVGDQGDGLLAFKESEEGKFGYIDEAGRVVIPPAFTGAQPFTAQRAIVNASEDYSGKYGVIDKKGNYVIQPQYDTIYFLGEINFAAGKALDPEKPYMGIRYAISDMNGKLLTDLSFVQVSEYKSGAASVSNGKETFFVDVNGRRIQGLPSVMGDGTLSLEGELIRADVDLRVYYLNREGKIIWQPNRVIILNEQYKVMEEKYNPNKDYLVYYPRVDGMIDNTAEKGVNDKLKELSQVKPIDPDAQLDSSYTGDFSVEFFKNRLLVLELNGYDYPFGAAHGMPTKAYPHVDLVTGRFYELKDLFKEGSGYVKILSDIIGEEIKTNPEYSYVFPDTYKGIRPDQPFYVDEENLFIYFTPYEIAPYAAGFPTFKIPFKQIESIIDEKREFWRAFH